MHLLTDAPRSPRLPADRHRELAQAVMHHLERPRLQQPQTNDVGQWTIQLRPGGADPRRRQHRTLGSLATA
jgi:hypothetical protein